MARRKRERDSICRRARVACHGTIWRDMGLGMMHPWRHSGSQSGKVLVIPERPGSVGRRICRAEFIAAMMPVRLLPRSVGPSRTIVVQSTTLRAENKLL